MLSCPRLVTAHRHLDFVPVGVAQERRVGAGAVRAPLTRLADPLAAVGNALLPGGLDRDDAEAGEAEQAEARLRRMVRGDEEDRLGDTPPDRLVLLEVAPPAQRREQRVVEGRAPLEVGDL